MSYGLDLMARATQGDAPALRQQLGGSWPECGWLPYEEVLIGERDLSPPQPGERLLSIFSRVRLPKATAQPRLAYHRPHLLELDGETLFPGDRDARTDPDREATWDGFKKAVTGVMQTGREGEGLFETFYHLMYRHAWALPCTYGEEGVSLFEEWKAVAALAHASGQEWADGPAKEFTLIGGDIPGIQDFVYTITSKGAAKGLRGRSFFVQLLGDAVVRRILADLELCPANVVYNAGGNFVVLGPEGVSEEKAKAISQRANQVLLDHFSGDLALAIGWASIPWEAIGGMTQGEEGWGTYEGRLKGAVNQAKRQPFARLAAEGWDKVFEPEGKGGDRFCAICRCELAEGRGRPLRDEDLTEPRVGQPLVCDDCHGFEELAQALAQEDTRLIVSTDEAGPASWQRMLQELTTIEAENKSESHPGFAYALTDEAPPPGAMVYVLSPGQFSGREAHGFRWLANTTPREPAEHDPRRKQIRPVNKMADDATSSFKRVGILRMDVDNLGQLFVTGIPQRTMMVTSGLSAALDRFFAGWLDEMIQETMADPGMAGVGKGKPELFYTIYAGGDDLFVVGTWDRVPSLAQRIRQEFHAYTGGHPDLNISAGISVEGAKFPIYRAAERAGDALEDGAKERRDGKGRPLKNGITFLEETYGWKEFTEVQDIVERLIDLVKGGVSRRVITLLRSIYARWLKDLEDGRATRTHPYFGPWMWLQAYALTRFKDQHPRAGAELEAIQKDVILSDKIGTLGLATRWAEYITRGGEGS
jgi:CRISPR-associated protein Csm1